MFRRLMFYIKDKKFNRRMARQRKKKGYADCDCWGMNYWFGETFPKMILNLRDMKHGAPELPFEEIDSMPLEWMNTELAKLKELREKEGYEINMDECFDRWYIVLTRIAFCLQQTNDELVDLENPYEEEYNKQVWGESFFDKEKSFKKWWEKHTEVVETDEKGKPKYYSFKTNEPDEDLKKKYWEVEESNGKYREAMKDEAFNLLKKYFWNLWD